MVTDEVPVGLESIIRKLGERGLESKTKVMLMLLV